MNALPFDNTFTGETQEQCACCKQWGWKDEVQKLHSGPAVIRVCDACLTEFEVTHGRKIESDTLESDAANDLRAYIDEHETPMSDYLAEAKAELNRTAFAKLKRRMGL